MLPVTSCLINFFLFKTLGTSIHLIRIALIKKIKPSTLPVKRNAHLQQVKMFYFFFTYFPICMMKKRTNNSLLKNNNSKV
ncbi:hypothetical protein PPACK8108_LOCUS2352 [Phakopsora pachyrhizi]|uniref:Uncharacterized protein n=1 Tax=Phakopsora pachyrhizi TaxID=170000 RepID=A0AAV0AHQ3_PHAPC|nr:hypothetical protein PPACK8108_LOCUS2352 [Phakopsora pachyrhizi]